MTDPIDEFLDRYPPDIKAISLALRAQVNKVMPDADEILYASQNHVDYSLTESSRDRIVYICPLQNYVRLGFWFGAHLPDPDHLLVGEGTRLRHIKIRALEEVQRPAIDALLASAWTHAVTHMKKKPGSA
ncbi:MAG: DUF1801 domain-containing protein [Anaerolineae bacterium]|nr:DUF1801 domain-containing protein [Anaerolineae bacterium]